MKDRKVEHLLGTFVLGVAFGAGLTFLLTPWSGGEVREKIGLSKEKPEKKVERVKKRLARIEGELEHHAL